jgi:hypothetical protein
VVRRASTGPNVRTTTGFAFGTESGDNGFDDSTATVNGTWGANQTVQPTVHVVSTSSTEFEEVELRVRTTITASSITGYEINCSVNPSNQYIQIVKWLGGIGSFSLLGGQATTALMAMFCKPRSPEPTAR